MENIKIVADSAADVLTLEHLPYEYVPLKIIADREYVDDTNLDVAQMADRLKSYKGKSSTSCPNTTEWLEAFGDAEFVFCVTITGTLSGSYSSAMAAKEIYEEMHPRRKVFVLDSLTAGPEIMIILERLQELILSGSEFEQVCDEINQYTHHTGLLFMLESMRNLANNGRVSPLVAKVVGILGVRIVGKASDVGDLQPLNKCRGEASALQNIVGHLEAMGLNKGKVRIGHCANESAAQSLRRIILEHLPQAQVEIYPSRGLCSFYAERGGLLIGFEKF